MAESQNSSSSSSDKDSLLSSDKNIPAVVPNCDNKGIETDLASVDDEDGSKQLQPSKEEHCPSICTVKMDEQDMMRPSHHEQRSNVEAKQPKTIKNIMMALKEGKVRENSPMRSNRSKAVGVSTQRTNSEALSKIPKLSAVAPGFKSNTDIPPIAPPKVALDFAKRIQGSHPLKHQVILSSFKLNYFMFIEQVLSFIFIYLCSYQQLTPHQKLNLDMMVLLHPALQNKSTKDFLLSLGKKHPHLWLGVLHFLHE